MKRPNSFDSEFFSSNREKLRKTLSKNTPIVVSANGALASDNYSAFTFRQDSSFWYLTGINKPDIVLVIDKEGDYLIMPKQSAWQLAADGELDYGQAQKISGVADVLSARQGWTRLRASLKIESDVATLAPDPTYMPQLTIYSNPARKQLVSKLKRYSPKSNIINLRQQMAGLRMIKSEIELESIRFAIDHTIRAYALIGKKLDSYDNEQSIAADVAHYFTKNRLSYSYDPIIAGGPRSNILHYQENDSPLVDGQCILIDMGARTDYCSDITRTVAIKPSKRLEQVYEATLAVQNFAIDYLRPGILIKDYEVAVNKFMGEKLIELGLINTNEPKFVREFYPHATSHFLGLDTHDVGDYTKPFEAGMVLAVEPGIYIRAENIGIRIEDDVVITKEGNTNLSQNLSRSINSLKMESE